MLENATEVSQWDSSNDTTKKSNLFGSQKCFLKNFN